MTNAKKYTDYSWDFTGSNTKRYTHCYHNYPAMMIPQVAERIIGKYAVKSSMLLDPYCGTGTSLVEANIKGINSIGTDINPLALLIARAKTASVNVQVLDLFLKDFNNYMFTHIFNIDTITTVIPEINNIDFWFNKSVQLKLAVIKDFIDKIEDDVVADFFRVAFSETVRESSYTRNSEFKLFRISKDKMQKFNPDVFGLMQSKLARNHRGLKSYGEVKTNATSSVFAIDSTKEIATIQDESVDIVVTSPPYGDSRTTVAYGQFSRLANEWLGVPNANQVDNSLMGGRKLKEKSSFNSLTLNTVINQIGGIDEKRAGEVVSFYWDYRNSIATISKKVKKHGYACYVVGNRKVKGVVLPTDEITKELFEEQGLTHIETIIRNIPNKRMPSKNSPSNVTGMKDDTMTNEYIVIMQKV